MQDKDPYKKIRIIKEFHRGLHADTVFLLEKNIIKKSYKKENRDIFEKEVNILLRLKELDFVPQVLWINYQKYYFYMTYCGSALNNIKLLKKHEKTINGFIKILKDKFNLYHNDIKPSNICIKDGKIYLIDFSWANEEPFKRSLKENRAGYNTVFDYENRKKKK